MNLADIKELIALMRKNKIQEIDLEQEGSKVRILSQEPASKKQRDSEFQAPPPPYAMPAPYFMPHMPPPGNGQAALAPAPEAPAASAPIPAAESAPAVEEEKPSNLVEIKSPMVGTFYRSPAPDAPPYVDEGLTVTKDTVLCIIEAMKLMNEIKSDANGRIVKILVENAQPVEFGQPLFLIDPM